MDRQRLLRCPPDQAARGQANPFEKMVKYRYAQQTFKEFTDSEVRNQAGKDVLPNYAKVESESDGEEERADEKPDIRDSSENSDDPPPDKRQRRSTLSGSQRGDGQDQNRPTPTAPLDQAPKGSRCGKRLRNTEESKEDFPGPGKRKGDEPKLTDLLSKDKKPLARKKGRQVEIAKLNPRPTPRPVKASVTSFRTKSREPVVDQKRRWSSLSPAEAPPPAQPPRQRSFLSSGPPMDEDEKVNVKEEDDDGGSDHMDVDGDEGEDAKPAVVEPSTLGRRKAEIARLESGTVPQGGFSAKGTSHTRNQTGAKRDLTRITQRSNIPTQTPGRFPGSGV